MNEYKQMNDYIDQVTQRSMVLYKQDLLSKFKSALMSSPAEGSAGDFYYTTLLPGDFASPTSGWTKFTFYQGDFESNSDTETSKWGVSGGLIFGVFNIGGTGGGSHV